MISEMREEAWWPNVKFRYAGTYDDTINIQRLRYMVIILEKLFHSIYIVKLVSNPVCPSTVIYNNIFMRYYDFNQPWAVVVRNYFFDDIKSKSYVRH